MQRLICDKRPEQLKMDFALWNRGAIRQLIEQECGISMPIRTVGHYLKRWGFTPQKPIRRAYGGPLSSRFSAARVPGNDWLCKIGLSTLISLMACKGIKDFDSGIRVFKDALYVYHERKSFYLGLTFDDYIQEKIAIKARQFNTILNRSIEAEEQASIDKDAAEYRKQSDGE